MTNLRFKIVHMRDRHGIMFVPMNFESGIHANIRYHRFESTRRPGALAIWRCNLVAGTLRPPSLTDIGYFYDTAPANADARLLMQWHNFLDPQRGRNGWYDAKNPRLQFRDDYHPQLL